MMNEFSKNFEYAGRAASDGLDVGRIKRVRRHTWHDSQDQNQVTANREKKKQRQTSLGSTDDKKGDLIGSILSGMWNPINGNQKPEWEGQPNRWELHNSYMMHDPLKLDTTSLLSAEFQNATSSTSCSQLPSVFKKPSIMEASHSQSFGNNFKQRRIGNRNAFLEREQLQAKARSLEMEKANLVKVTVDGTTSVVQNTDSKKMTKEKSERRGISKEKETSAGRKNKDEKSNSKLKFTKGMENDSKPWRSKSNYKGSQRLGSMRTCYRPDRAYDFNRNNMEVNDPETPNDEFDHVRI